MKMVGVQKSVKHLLVASKDVDAGMLKENISQCTNTTIMVTFKTDFAFPQLKDLLKPTES